ncbi:hypothetical protein GOV11_04130 [Candidatus Woesearchaeota archaeon]|nr:hypothetical protein [Candidatus Woesearchaeota archaeon]
MRYLQLLIDQSRRATDNTDFSDSTGISTEEFIQYMNDAQNRMQSLIVQVNADLFQAEAIIDAIQKQEAFDIPSDAFLGNRLDLVEFSSTGQDSDYVQLKQGRLPERFSGVASTPAFYIRRSGAILIQPQSDDLTGTIRMTYVKKLPILDIRRGKVGSSTVTSTQLTALTLDSTFLIDKTSLEESNFLTIVDKNGIVKMDGIGFTEINETSGVVTLDGSHTFDSGQTFAVGDFVVRGLDATTHSELPDITERYLLEYTNNRILNRDSSNDVGTQTPLLAEIEREIIETFSEPDGDVDYVTILDDQYLPSGDDYG